MHMNPVLWPHHRGEEGGLGITSGGGGGGGTSSSMLSHAGYHQPPVEQGGSGAGAATPASALISPSHGAFGSMAAMSPSAAAQGATTTATSPAAAAAYTRSQQFSGGLNGRPAQNSLSPSGGGGSESQSQGSQGSTIGGVRTSSPQRVEGGGRLDEQSGHQNGGGEDDSERGGGGGGGGGGSFVADDMLTMISPTGYSQQLDLQQQLQMQQLQRRDQDQQYERQKHQMRMQHQMEQQPPRQHQMQDVLQQQQQQHSRSSSANWPPSQNPANDDWTYLLRPGTPPISNGQLTPAFSAAAAWPPMQNAGEKQPWGVQSALQLQQRQHVQTREKQHRQDGQQQRGGPPSPTRSAAASFSGLFTKQQQQPQGNWSVPRPNGTTRSLSPQPQSGGFYAGKEYLPPLREGGQEGGRGARVSPGTDPSEASDGTDDVAGGSMCSGTPSTSHQQQRQQMSSSHNPNAAYQEDLRMFVEGRGISHASARPLSSSAHVNNAGSAAIAAVAATSSSPSPGSATASPAIETKHDPASSLPRGVLDMATLKVPGHSTPTAATFTASSSDDGNSPLLARNSGGSGRVRVNIRQAPGTPESGGPASKAARTGTATSARGVGGDAGGGKADGTTGGGGETKSAARRRSPDDSSREVMPEERLKLNRERNRDHSRRSRERKKALVEGLKKQVSELGPYRLLVEEAHDLISAHSTDINAVFTFASGGFDRLLGMDPSGLLGVSFLELVDPNDSQEVLRSILSTLRRGGIRQVQYRMRPPVGAHAAEVETSFRLVSTRLLAVTRVRGRSPAPASSTTPSLPSLAVASAPHVAPSSPLLVQALPLQAVGGRDEGGMPLPSDMHNDW